MNASIDKSIDGMAAAYISTAETITDNTYIPHSNLIRVVSTSDPGYIKLQSDTTAGNGMLLCQNCVEYFSVVNGEPLKITGTVNISSIE